MINVLRGNIYFVNMPKHDVNNHCCETGRRPCVIVSNNVGNRTSRVVLVCPMTCKIKDISCNIDISWKLKDKPSQVLCNHITAIPVEALSDYQGRLTDEEMRNVDIGMMKSLGIKINYEVYNNDSKY